MAYDPYAIAMMMQYPQGYYNQQPGLGGYYNRGFGRSPYGMPQGTGAAVPLPAAAPSYSAGDYGDGEDHHGMGMGQRRPFSPMMLMKTFREDNPYMFGGFPPQNALMYPTEGAMPMERGLGGSSQTTRSGSRPVTTGGAGGTAERYSPIGTYNALLNRR